MGFFLLYSTVYFPKRQHLNGNCVGSCDEAWNLHILWISSSWTVQDIWTGAKDFPRYHMVNNSEASALRRIGNSTCVVSVYRNNWKRLGSYLTISNCKRSIPNERTWQVSAKQKRINYFWSHRNATTYWQLLTYLVGVLILWV